MKLLRLKINNRSGFRSLKRGFEIIFSEPQNDGVLKFNPYILAGRNGSGKSNILEALAEIFYHLDGIYLSFKPDYFEKHFDPAKSRINAYELEFLTYLDLKFFPEINNQIAAHIHIEKKSAKRPFVKILNYKEISENLNTLSASQIKSVLPDYVVGYASGLNETLSIPFFKSRLLQYDRYFHDLESQEFADPSPENSLVLIDEKIAQAIALTCLLMFDDPETGELSPALEPFRNYIDIDQLDSFRIILRKDQEVDIYNKKTKKTEKIPLIQNLNISSEGNIGANSTRSYIEKLKKCSTFKNEISGMGYADADYSTDGYFETHNYITFDFKVTNATKKAFQLHFEDEPLKLFEFLQLSFVLNNYIINQRDKLRAYTSPNPFIQYDIAQIPVEDMRIIRFKDMLIKKSDINNSIYTKNLSDGEFQFLQTLGLCLLFKDTNSLFLLDEPETHFNPDWKAKYISSIRDCFSYKNPNNYSSSNYSNLNDLLITTHSPFLVSDSKREHVFVFKEGKVSHPEIKTFGTSVNIITEEVFEKTESISDLSLELIDKIKNLDLSTSQKIQEAKEQARVLGESVEKVLLFRELLLKEAEIKKND